MQVENVTSNNPTGHDGYSNYETWLVSQGLNNDQVSYNALEALRIEPVSDYKKAEQLEELVRELYNFEPTGIVADLVNASFDRVNWIEIIRE